MMLWAEQQPSIRNAAGYQACIAQKLPKKFEASQPTNQRGLSRISFSDWLADINFRQEILQY